MSKTVVGAEGPSATNGRWTSRQLAEEERARIRPAFSSDSRRDLPYLAAVGIFGLLSALAGAILLPPVLGPEAIARLAAGAACFLAAAGLAWAFDSRRLIRAVRGRRARTPRWTWVAPVDVSHSADPDSPGGGLEVRCTVQGRLRRLPVTPAQLEWFPEGAAQVEILSGGRYPLYRFRFARHTVEVFPEIRLLEGNGSPPAAEPADGAATSAARGACESHAAAPAGTLCSVWDADEVRIRSGRRKRRGSRSPVHRARFGRLTRREIAWGLVVLITGAGITLFILEFGNRVQGTESE